MIFNELDHRLSVVPRWVVLATIQNQSVAEHCFNVERIARRIARDWLNISELDAISQAALHHDDEESLTGDIPSPAKKKLMGEKYLDGAAGGWYNGDDRVRAIVKLADLMEAFWFLSMEMQMGNRYVVQHHQDMAQQMFDHGAQFGDEVKSRLNEWVASMKFMRSETHG